MKRILKLNYLLEKCETHKGLEPQFSLHFNDLTETIRELREGNNDDDVSRGTFQSSFGKNSHFGMLDANGDRLSGLRGLSADGKMKIN